MKNVDPSRMAPADRLAELAEILAAGVQRFLARESKSDAQREISAERLDVDRLIEAPCRATPKVPA